MSARGGVGGPSYLPCVCVYQQEKLQSATSESNELSSDIHNRRQKLQRLEGKLQGAEEVRHESPQRPLFRRRSPSLHSLHTSADASTQERRGEEALNQRLRRQVSEYEAPGVAEYMRAKGKLGRLQQSVHTWEKKVEVAQVTQGLSAPQTESLLWVSITNISSTLENPPPQRNQITLRFSWAGILC